MRIFPVFVMSVLTSLILVGCTSGTSFTESDGVALIDELIACDQPGAWDRDRMIYNLEQDRKEYIDTLTLMLEVCTLAKNTTPDPTSTPLPLIDEALELLAHYHELLRFKDNPEFHQVCYSRAYRYAEWVDRGKALGERSEASLREHTGIHPTDLWNMGREYCDSQGQETNYTQWLNSQMKPHWLDALPTPQP